VAGCRAPQDRGNPIGGGVLVAKAQHPLEGCSQAVNVVSSISRVIPRLSSKD
jgi:hypothetical protein